MEHQIGSAYRKWLCLYCCVWPSFATLTCSTFTLQVSVQRLRFFSIWQRVAPHPAPTCGLQAHRGTHSRRAEIRIEL